MRFYVSYAGRAPSCFGACNYSGVLQINRFSHTNVRHAHLGVPAFRGNAAYFKLYGCLVLFENLARWYGGTTPPLRGTPPREGNYWSTQPHSPPVEGCRPQAAGWFCIQPHRSKYFNLYG